MARLPLRAWLLLAVLAAMTVSCIRPASWLDMLFEHLPTAVTLAVLICYGIRRPLSDFSYVCLFVFMLLHILGAHYLYSNVPYDDWARTVFGRDITGTFNLGRNHYDRFVHLMWGVLLMPPVADMAVRFGATKRGFWAALFALGFTALGGTIYEILEWLLTLVASPEAAENYNGQQGDMFDAQKDLTLNLAGAVFSAVVMLVAGRARDSRVPG